MKIHGSRLFPTILLLCARSVAADAAVSPPLDSSLPGATILDSVTVIATRGEHSVGDAPGSVTVIDAERIASFLMRDVRDLVAYEPGVYIESSPRLGLGAFNIRGIGGNRVLTRIDGVPAAESFEFGHFEVPPFALDLQALDRVEILRGPGSSLYGSDALGGVVSFETLDPIDLVTEDDASFLGLSTAWDGRAEQTSAAGMAARGGETWQALLAINGVTGAERINQGRVATRDTTRTAPDPQDNHALGFLGKVVRRGTASNEYELAFEAFAHEAETDLLSDLGSTNLGAIFGFPPDVTYLVDKTASTARDEQKRWRLSLESSRAGGLVDHLLWRVFSVASSTEQRTQETRATTRGGGAFGPLTTAEILRSGLVTFDQDSLGLEIQARQALAPGARRLLTFGAAASVDRFDQLRDRLERDGAHQALPPSDGLTYPTKYFPSSRVVETGVFAQAEIGLAEDRVVLVPGVRYDRMELAVDEHDAVFLAGNEGTQPPVELADAALSPKLAMVLALGKRTSLHAQYAQGFRAPPYSAINSGFTHLAGGLTRLPNPSLQPEESAGFELGLRFRAAAASVSLTLFDNRYDGFIELINLGLNATTGLIEFQQQNLAAARIRGLEVAADARCGDLWYLRTGLAWTEGEDRTRSVPLNSIPPPQITLGLRRTSGDRRWQADLAARLVAAKDRNDIDTRTAPQFATPGYATVDLYSSHELSPRLSLVGGLRNLTDAAYWEWADARGQSADSPALDRFTAPGRSLSLALRLHY